METTRLIIFFSVVGLLTVGIDFYVFLTWKKFIRRRQYPRWMYLTPMVIALVMLPLMIFMMWYRRMEPTPTAFTMSAVVLLSLWYIPKLPVALTLLVKDILRLCRWVFRGVRQLVRGAQPTTENDRQTAVRESRRAFVQSTGWALAGVPFLMVGNGLVRTVHDLKIVKLDIPIARLPRAFEGLVIAQISDIHAGSHYSDATIAETRRILEEAKPDIIAVTGDWVNFNPRELAGIYHELEKIDAPLGVYGSLGNHDHYMTHADHRLLNRELRAANIDLLVNENRSLNIDGGVLQLAGIDNIGLRQRFGDIEQALSGLAPDAPTVLLGHDPTFWDKGVRNKQPIDLMLTGHTHGGQIGLHVLGREMSFAQIVYKQWVGHYQDGDQHLYINRGLGTTGLPIRVGIRPEITFFTLRRPEPAGV